MCVGAVHAVPRSKRTRAKGQFVTNGQPFELKSLVAKLLIAAVLVSLEKPPVWSLHQHLSVRPHSGNGLGTRIWRSRKHGFLRDRRLQEHAAEVGPGLRQPSVETFGTRTKSDEISELDETDD